MKMVIGTKLEDIITKDNVVFQIQNTIPLYMDSYALVFKVSEVSVSRDTDRSIFPFIQKIYEQQLDVRLGRNDDINVIKDEMYKKFMEVLYDDYNKVSIPPCLKPGLEI